MDPVVKSAYIGAIATLAAAVLGLGGQAISKGASDRAADQPAATASAVLPPGRCASMIREVRKLPRADPRLAAELAPSGDARLPSLWSVDEIRQCGGVEPERLLEGPLAKP